MKRPSPGEKLEEWYDEDYFRRYPCHDRRISQILRNISFSPSDRVCEFGSGLGHILSALSPSISYGLGLDFSEFAISETRRRCQDAGISNLEFKAIDIESLISDASLNGQFDKVLMMDISEHLYDDTLRKFFASARHILAPNGVLYIHTPNAGYYLEILKSHNLILKQFPSHIAVRGCQAYKVALTEAGFFVDSVTMLPHYNLILGKVDALMMKLPYVKYVFMSRILIKAKAR